MHPGLIRGRFASWTGSNRAGEIVIRNFQGLSSCLFDARTYFARDQHMIAVSALIPGDPVEVVADHKPGSTACYARTVEVPNMHPSLFTPGVRPPLRRAPSPTESFAPRGDLAFGGRIVKLDLAAVTVKTRQGEIQLILRPDTRYAADGVTLDSDALRINTNVFIRAGHDVNGAIEAYQIFWGHISGPF